MESEEVKEIKEKLQEEIFLANSFGDRLRRIPTTDLRKILNLFNELESENERLMKLQSRGGCRVAELGIENQQLKDRIAELEDENEMLKILVDIANERTYRKKFIEEWRKEYQKELDKQGKGSIAGSPDFDLVYKLYFEQKDRIAELESENAYKQEHIEQCTKEIAEKIWSVSKNTVDATKHIVQGREYLHLDALKEIIKSLGVEIKE